MVERGGGGGSTFDGKVLVLLVQISIYTELLSVSLVKQYIIHLADIDMSVVS